MSQRAAVPLKLGPLQYVVAEPITDPAEQAAIDQMRKRQRGKKAGRKPLKPSPLQYVVGIPITDPAEQAAIDRMRKRLKKKKAGAKTKGKRG